MVKRISAGLCMLLWMLWSGASFAANGRQAEICGTASDRRAIRGASGRVPDRIRRDVRRHQIAECHFQPDGRTDPAARQA